MTTSTAVSSGINNVASKKESKLGIDAKKEEDFSGWYTQVLLRSEMIDYYDISGCYILRPLSFSVWKEIQSIGD